MTRIYRLGRGARLRNMAFSAMTLMGLGARHRYVLSVAGRTSGMVRSTPVDVMADHGARWLVAAYGATGWVLNARAAGLATLSRGGRSEKVSVVELDIADSVSVLRQFLREVPDARPYFEATTHATNVELQMEASRHPVFVVLPVTADSECNGDAAASGEATTASRSLN